MVLWLLLGCSALSRLVGCPAPAIAAPVPIFSRPFEGDRLIPNFFDHGSDQKNRQLTTTGRTVGGTRGHEAYDFQMPVGTALYAMADGVVLKAGDLGPKNCGSRPHADQDVEVWVMTDPAPDGNRYVYEFRHLSEVLVAKGERVANGRVVAKSGNTGCSSGPHLHLEVLHVTDPDRGKGWTVDPYGWSGASPDPRAAKGHVSPNLWIPGQAPAIRRSSHHEPGALEFGPQRMVGTDGQDPVGGEWVDLGLAAAAPASRSLAGMKLRNGHGDVFDLPPRTLAPGQTLRVWTRNPNPGPDGVSLDRSVEVWDDLSDCAELVDADHRVTGVLRFGGGHAECKGWNGPSDDGTEVPPEDDGDG